jgi:hypothetical protein
MDKGSIFPTSFPSLAIICFLDDSRYDWGEMESQHSFDLHLLYG